MSDVKKPQYSVKVITAPVQKAENQTSLTREEESAAGEWIRPAYELRGLAALVENSSILPQCIRAYKGNIAGFGIAVKYKDDVEETAEMSEEFAKAETIIRRLNNDKDITEVFEDIVEARETYGIAYAEVIRTLEGDVSQLEFIEDTVSIEKSVPLEPYVDYSYFDNGEEVKARKRFRKYKQQIGGKTVYFKEFGDPRVMDMRDGRYTEEGLEAEFAANEIIDFPIGTKPYGTVRWIGQTLGVDGSRRAESLNNNYFINGRHTPMMIMLQGGSLTDDSYTKLQNYMSDIKGENGQHAFIVLEVENTDSRADFDAAEKPQIQIKDMAAMLQKDELFQGYLDNNRRRAQSSFLLPDLYVGYTTDFNRATAQTAQEVTEQQVFQPERNSLAWIVNNKLLNGYNFKHVEAYFRAPDLNNPEDLANLLTICNAAGGLTPNKAKSILYNALGEVSEDYEGDWANEPLARAGMQADPSVEEQLEKQIAKAAAHGNDEVVAVMREVRNFLQKGLTKPQQGDIIKADDDTKWITTPEGNRVPLNEEGNIVSPAELRNTNAQKALNEAIEDGKVITKLNKDKQSDHRQGSAAYQKRIKAGQNPSYVTLSNMELQKLVNTYSGKGKVYIDKAGKITEIFEHTSPIGFCVDKFTGEAVATNNGKIHYSKDGTHIVPTLTKT